MLITLFLCLLLIFPVSQEPNNQAKRLPLTSRVSFKLKANKASFYSHEPLLLSCILKNETDNELIGTFCPGLINGNLDIFYRRKDSEFIKYISGKQSVV